MKLSGFLHTVYIIIFCMSEGTNVHRFICKLCHSFNWSFELIFEKEGAENWYQMSTVGGKSDTRKDELQEAFKSSAMTLQTLWFTFGTMQPYHNISNLLFSRHNFNVTPSMQCTTGSEHFCVLLVYIFSSVFGQFLARFWSIFSPFLVHF